VAGTEPGPVAGRTRPPADHALARMGRAIRHNRKATTGTILLVIFLFAALFPGLIAHDSPSADALRPEAGAVHRPPARHHRVWPGHVGPAGLRDPQT